MAAGRALKSLGRRRHVGGDDEEDDDGQLLAGDSHSEGSIITDVAEEQQVEHGDEQASSEVQPVTTQSGQINGTKKQNKSKKQPLKTTEESAIQIAPRDFKQTADTEAMLHGLSITDRTDEVIDFGAVNTNDNKSKQRSTQDQSKQRREHEEYKKKRDADPAFIPNRGNFFMHDTRGQHNGGPAAARGSLASRGRGRGGPELLSGFNTGRGDRASEQVWKHDLHSSINEEPATKSATQSENIAIKQEKSATGIISFSSTHMLGRIQLRVLIPGMTKPVIYSEVPAVKYVRLPDHRPPLRRDKPVRIFLPAVGPRYIFPSAERSFIFIPRQMRPNNRGSAGPQQRNIGGYGYSSRRTSMYGGSMYSASVAASRRSSITRDRETMFSPASYASAFQPPHRPVVRLPHNGQYYPSATPPMIPYSGQHTPIGQIHTYPLPQQLALQGTPTTQVQHPRPQKAISVSGIESPAMLSMQQPPPDVPFQGQLPPSMSHHSAHPSQGSISYDYSQQQYGYPPAGSPLTRIPENTFPPPQMFYPSQPGYYYPPMPVYGYPPVQQQPYSVPSQQSVQDSQPPAPQANEGAAPQSGTGTVAHESNGMVFYMPAADAAAMPNAPDQFQPAEGFVPSFAAAGMPPTPAPDQSVYYYGMPPVTGNMGYYPPIQQS